MASDDTTRAYDFGGEQPTDEVDLSGLRTDDAPTVAFTSPPAEADPAARSHSTQPVFEDGWDAPTVAAPRADAPQPVAPPVTRPAPEPARAPAPAPQTFRPAAPVTTPAPRPAGPGGFARFGAVVLALALSVAGLAAVAVAVFAAAFEGLTTILPMGEQAMGVTAPVAGLLAGACFLLAALTARLSGAGVGLTGLLSVLTGMLLVFLPGIAVDTLVGSSLYTTLLETFGLAGAVESVGDSVTGVVAAVIRVSFVTTGVVALVVGLAFLGVGFAVHGARHAGWRRGAGH